MSMLEHDPNQKRESIIKAVMDWHRKHKKGPVVFTDNPAWEPAIRTWSLLHVPRYIGFWTEHTAYLRLRRYRMHKSYRLWRTPKAMPWVIIDPIDRRGKR